MKLFFLFVFCFFLPVSWSQLNSISSFETRYVLLNVNTSLTSSPGSVLTPPTHHYIEIPNIDFTSFTTGFSIEGWVLWRGTNLCPNPQSCGGIANEPLFLIFKDNSNYFYFTPAVNDSLTGTSNYEYGYNSLSVSSSSFAQTFTFLGNDNSPYTPTSVPGFHWAHVSFSWQSSGDSELVISQLIPQGQISSPASYTYTLPWSGWNPSSLGVTSLYIGGFDTTVPPPPGTATNFLLANVAEIRIWNKFRTTSEVLSTQQSSLNGNEPNLVHYWRLDEPSGLTVFDSSGSNNGLLKYQTGDAYLPSRTLNSQPETIVYAYPSSTLDDTRFFSLNNISRTINATSIYNFGTTTTLRTSQMNVQFSSLLSTLTSSSGSFSTSCPQYDYNQICDNTFSFSPSRQYCGTISNLILNYQYTSGGTTYYSTSTTFVFNITSLGAPVITNSHYHTPTIGGTVTFSGSNFGADGSLASNEYLKININSNTINCNGTVSNNAIQCIIPPGVGTGGTVVFSSCGTVATFPSFFSYDPPSIISVSGTNASTLLIMGQNFGTFPNQVTVQILTSSGIIPCIIDTVTDTSIICNNDNILTSGQNYNISVTVAGQTYETIFTYDICQFPCQNGGKCVGFDTCDCSGLSYGGIDCSQPISCYPACKNNGICINNNLDIPVCNCTVGFSGTDCGTKEVQGTNSSSSFQSKNSIIGGVIGAILGLIFIIILI